MTHNYYNTVRYLSGVLALFSFTCPFFFHLVVGRGPLFTPAL
jgi:hypothetical protein